jgi:hypothetical protein
VTGGLYELGGSFTEALYSSITSESYFMKTVFSLQSELRTSFNINVSLLICKSL